MGLGDGVECGRRWCKDPQTELLMEALQQTNQRRESRRCLGSLLALSGQIHILRQAPNLQWHLHLQLYHLQRKVFTVAAKCLNILHLFDLNPFLCLKSEEKNNFFIETN